MIVSLACCSKNVTCKTYFLVISLQNIFPRFWTTQLVRGCVYCHLDGQRAIDSSKVCPRLNPPKIGLWAQQKFQRKYCVQKNKIKTFKSTVNCGVYCMEKNWLCQLLVVQSSLFLSRILHQLTNNYYMHFINSLTSNNYMSLTDMFVVWWGAGRRTTYCMVCVHYCYQNLVFKYEF